MPAMKNSYEAASVGIQHFIAVDAALFTPVAGSNPELVQADKDLYLKICALTHSGNNIDVVALDANEAKAAQAILIYLSHKTAQSPLKLDVVLASDMEEGYYSTLITERPTAFGGKVQAHSVVAPQNLPKLNP